MYAPIYAIKIGAFIPFGINERKTSRGLERDPGFT
ncbi:hypothetical protein SPPR111872_04505 [Sphingobacterium prati]